MKASSILKRAGAYLIDLFIVTLFSTALLYISFLNPKYDKYLEASDKYNEVLTKYYEKEIDIKEFNQETQEYSYIMNKNGYVYVIGDIVIIFLYFGLFAYWTKGQTLGKKLFSLKIVSNKDKELKPYNYFIRAFILNSVILKICTLIAVCFNKSTYFKIYNTGSNIDSILLMIIMLMILFNKEGRGLHDMIAGTKVIDLKDKELKASEEVIKPTKKETKEEKN